MNYNLLYYFKVLGDVEHFGKAAKILNIEQPTLSQSIHRLEESLGNEPLFEKSGRNIKLTERGRQFHARISKGYNLLIEAERDLMIEQNQVLIVSSVHTQFGTGFPIIISEFNKMMRDQGSSLRVNVVEHHTPESFELIMAGQCDMLVCSYIDERYKLDYYPIGTRDISLYVSINHRFAARKEVLLEEIVREPFILFSEGTGMHHHSSVIFRKAGAEPNCISRASSTNMVLSMVASGLGIALCPKQNYQGYANVCEVKVTDMEYYITYYLACLSHKTMSKQCVRLKEYILDNMIMCRN